MDKQKIKSFIKEISGVWMTVLAFLAGFPVGLAYDILRKKAEIGGYAVIAIYVLAACSLYIFGFKTAQRPSRFCIMTLLCAGVSALLCISVVEAFANNSLSVYVSYVTPIYMLTLGFAVACLLSGFYLFVRRTIDRIKNFEGRGKKDKK